MILRDYQTDAVNAVFQWWDRGTGKNCLVCSPTGSGKSVIIAELVRQIVTGWPDTRVMVIVDSRELIAQNCKTLNIHAPNIKTGVYSSGLDSRQTRAQVLFCGIQSVYSKAFEFEKTDVIIIDECQMISRKAQSRYAVFLKDMSVANPSVTLVGFSATIFRMDTGMLHEGDGALFQGIAYVCDMKRLINEKYLVPLISKGGGSAKINLSGVKIQGHEYNQTDLAYAADDPELIRLAVNEIVECGKDRKAWLVFTCGLSHSEHVASEFRKHNIDCEIVTGDTPSEERDNIVNKFRDGKLRCLINVAVFTKGFDVPRVDLLALMTSTRSTGKFVQICGRGMRPFPGKDNCLLLDFGSNVILHGMVDEIDPQRKKDIFQCVKKAPPVKECPSCGVIFHARIMTCPSCGFKYDIPEATAKHGVEAYSGAVMSDQVEPFLVDVKDVWVSKHAKPGKTTSVKLSFYDSMEKEYPMWIFLDHKGYAQEKALALVKQLGGKATTVEEALKEWPQWKKMDKIQVRMEGKWPRIIGFVPKKNQTVQEHLGVEEEAK